ncbi:MAG: hypothetical protein IT370_03725 [Deltaproteobacteria bacterium]|nr:hypothetical protein [Deltaproteobacteria bacterium]
MALLRPRPRLALPAPRGRPGHTFTVTLIIDCAEAVPVSGVRLRLTGRERFDRGELADSHELLDLEQTIPLSLLPPGRQQLQVSFALPPALPPSHDGTALDVLYVVEARVLQRRRTDTVSSWTVTLDAPPSALTRPGQPHSAASARPERGSSAGAAGAAISDEPLLEISLGASVVAAGDVLTGALALSNVPTGARRGCELALIGYERPRIAADDADPESQRFAFPALTLASADGQPTPFEVTLPRGLTPSFKSRLGALEWRLEARAYTDVGNLVVRLPLHMLASQGAALPPQARVAPPVIGSERVRSLWDKVATKLGLEHRDGELRGAIAGSMLTISQERRGARRKLVGELAPRSLRLGLHVEPRDHLLRGPRGLAPDDVDGEDPRYAIHARERRQALTLLRALAPVLRRLPEASLSDTCARFVLADAGQHEARLVEFATTLGDLARALADARLAVPPPALLVSHVPAWRALTDSIGGTLETADMSITGQLRGLAIALRADWSDGDGSQLPGMTLEVTLPHPLAPEWHQTRIPASAAELPAAAAALLPRCISGSHPDTPSAAPADTATTTPTTTTVAAARDDDEATLTITAHSVALHLDATPTDPRPLLPRLDTLAELALLLRDQASPYR